MVAKGGDKLLADDAINALRERLLPRAYLVTPNHHEASALAERTIDNVDDMHEAAAAIHTFGARNVLVKGGDLPGGGEQALDVLSEGKTVIAIAHRLFTVLSSDCILYFENGKLVQQGPHDELLETSPGYKRIFELQFNQ